MILDKPYLRAVYLFRRDLRIPHNKALAQASMQAKMVFPCFIIDDRQVGDGNAYRSHRAMAFMKESLIDLDRELQNQQGKLYLFYNDPVKALALLHEQWRFDALFFNADYTPFARKRDAACIAFAKEKGISVHTYDDLLLHRPNEILKQDETPYTIFTPYYRKASMIPLAAEVPPIDLTVWCTQSIPSAVEIHDLDRYINVNNGTDRLTINTDIMSAGRTSGIRQLQAALEIVKTYDITRDIPEHTTSALSAHIKFGTLSVLEIYRFMSAHAENNESFLRQLYWRDFYTMIAYHFPKVFGLEFQEKFRGIAWSTNIQLFERWKHGETGFPFVDAGMRQLAHTGFMHNRVRMVTASFLTKDLHIDWRMGEQYFAQQLVDYDPCVNNGNWQWIASTGCDPQPYFRIFNPWLQQKKFDPDCHYIKKWIPELRRYSPKEIHQLETKRLPGLLTYPALVCDHQLEQKKTIAYFKKWIEDNGNKKAF